MGQSTNEIPCGNGKYAVLLKDRAALAAEIAALLSDDHRDTRSRNKVIARKAEASPRTVEAWLERRYLPGLECWLRLAVRSRSLQVMFLRLCEMEADSDPEFQKALSEFIRVAQR